MPFFSRIIKPLLALLLASAVLATQACAKDTKTEIKPAGRPAEPGAPRIIEISVTEKGYEPTPITLKQGEPVKLVMTRKTNNTCATEIVLDEYGINTKLPLNQPVEVTFTPTKSGKLVYGCAMDKMIKGVLMVE